MKTYITSSDKLKLIGISFIVGLILCFLIDYLIAKSTSFRYMYYALPVIITLIMTEFIHKSVQVPSDTIHDNINKIKDLKFKDLNDISSQNNYKVVNKDLLDLSESHELKVKQSEMLKDDEKDRLKYFKHMDHEIRTPLFGILGTVQILATTDITKVQFNYLDAIKSSSDQLMSLMEELMSYKPNTVEKTNLEFKAYYLEKAVNHTLSDFRDSVSKNNINLKVEVGEKVPEVIMGDESKLKQALSNVVRNAVKHTKGGNITVKVNTNLDNSIVVIQFEIQDTGIGMTDDVQKSLFDRSNPKENQRGLKIAENIVKAMGGQISIESHENIGTAVYFSIKSKLPKQSDVKELEESSLKFKE